MWSIVQQTVDYTTVCIFDDIDSSAYSKDRLTFEEFGTWYNNGGYKQVI